MELDAEFCNGAFKPSSSAEKQNGDIHQSHTEAVTVKTSSSPLSYQQETNSVANVLSSEV